MKKRLDQHLVDLGLAPSKTKAQEMIELGQVQVKSTKNSAYLQNLKSAKVLDLNFYEIQIKNLNLTQFVARSGFKLAGALRELKLDVTGLEVLDVGQSTGGFTDCLLQNGAEHVTGVDVGSGQLSVQLREHPSITVFEKINARELDQSTSIPPNHFDLAVVDVSFISLTKVLAPILSRVRLGGWVIALVKPQFEVGSVNIGKNGIVKNLDAVEEMKNQILRLAEDLFLINIQIFTSSVVGRDGNQEYFLFGEKIK